MSADLLRRAATKLRERANAATRGPWEMDGADGLVWPGCMGDPVSGSEVLADGAFIALMHPPVALALAEFLECQARAADSQREAEQRVGVPLGTLDSGRDFAAYALARAILREPEVTP